MHLLHYCIKLVEVWYEVISEANRLASLMHISIFIFNTYFENTTGKNATYIAHITYFTIALGRGFFSFNLGLKM